MTVGADWIIHHPRPSSVGGPVYRADKNAMASTTSHPTIANEATAPAVILAFSFVV
jgi:hypothetical protein